MDTQENKTENSEDKEVDFKVDFRKIICDNKILVGVILFFMVVIAVLYLIADEKSHNNFGDYFGGVLNPILAFISFIAILWTVALQRHSINLQSKELELTRKELEDTKNELAGSRKAQEQHTKLFEQQQFETTFFSLLKLIEEKQSLKYYSFTIYPLVKETINIIKNYTNKNATNNEDNSVKLKYINILKSQLNTPTLETLLIETAERNDKELYSYIKNCCFFELIEHFYLYRTVEDKLSQAEYKEIDTLLYFDISDFGENINYQCKVSQSEYVTGDFLDKLLEITKYDKVKINIAGNIKTNPDTLSKLFDNEYHNFEIIVAIAGNSSAPLNIFNHICNNIDNIIINHCNITKCDKKDHHQRIHNALVKNCHTDIELLKNISNENKDFIKYLCEENIAKLFDYYIKKFNDDIENNKNTKNKLHTLIDNYKNDFNKTKELWNNFLIELKKIIDNDKKKIDNDIIGKTDDKKQKNVLFDKCIKYYISDLETIIKKIEEKLK